MYFAGFTQHTPYITLHQETLLGLKHFHLTFQLENQSSVTDMRPETYEETQQCLLLHFELTVYLERLGWALEAA